MEAELRELNIRLIVSCEKGDEETVISLLEHEQKDCFINCVDKKNESALFKAARRGHLRIAQLLLRHGINVDSLNSDTSTPLIVASLYGHTSIVKLLLESAKCSLDHVSLTEGADRSALMIASENGDTETVKVLLEYGANVDTQSVRDEWTAMLFACKNGHTTIVKLLLEYKANICIQTQENRQLSALIVATQNGCYETVNVLIQCGADINVEGVMEPTETGQIVTPLMVASNKEMIKLLLQYGAKINKQIKEKG